MSAINLENSFKEEDKIVGSETIGNDNDDFIRKLETLDIEELQREETIVREQMVVSTVSNTQKARRTEVRTILFEYLTKVLCTAGRNC